MSDSRTTVFADGMTEASVSHGVARITLAQSGTDGKPIAVGQLCIPLMQLPAFANGLLNLLKQVEARAKQASQQQAGGKGNEGQNGDVLPGPVPGAFRFSG
jgi:hypothetical protein